jgi:hypothetical protein
MSDTGAPEIRMSGSDSLGQDLGDNAPRGAPRVGVEASDIILRTEGISKRFGALIVLRGIDIELRRGEVLGFGRRQRKREEHLGQDPERLP